MTGWMGPGLDASKKKEKKIPPTGNNAMILWISIQQ
jgi:hypothetical protein